MTAHTGIEHDAKHVQAIDDDFQTWLEENEVDTTSWTDFGNAVRDYTQTDRFFSFFHDGYKKVNCIMHWSHFSPFLYSKTKEFVETMEV